MFRKKTTDKKIENQTWYVIFCDSEDVPRPWRWFTRAGFRHCLCLAESPVGTLVMNYVDGGCEVRLAPSQSAMSMAIDFFNGGESRVLCVHTDKAPGIYYRGAVYCVTLTKSFLGIRGCWAVTPFGLHNWLKKSKLLLLDLNEVLGGDFMGGKAPKQAGPDPELKKAQQEQAERAKREAERLRQERIAGAAKSRRKQTGIFSLLKTEGGELGAPRSLLGGGQ